MLGSAFVIIAVGMAYKMLTVPSSDWTPTWKPTGPMYSLAQHSTADRIATYAFIFLFWGIFFIAGVAAVVASLRMMLLHWLFDKEAGVVTAGKRSWAMDHVCALHLKADTILQLPITVSLMMELPGGKQVRMVRSVISKGSTLPATQALLEPAARQIAEWLAVPLKF